jgi:hypothetical protein
MADTLESHASVGLPLHVLEAIHEVEEIQRRIKINKELHPKRGPKPLPRRVQHAVLIADSADELDELTKAFQFAVGAKIRGNKRLGRKHIYAALVQAFYQLKKLGIKLPRNKYLSRKATPHGLARTFVEYGLTHYSEEVIECQKASGTNARLKLARKHDSLLSRVADAIEGKIKNSPPPKIINL